MGPGDRQGTKARPGFVQEVANNATAEAVISVGKNTAVLLTAGMVARVEIHFQSLKNTIYFGFSNSVTKDTGMKISSKSLVSLYIDENVQVWAISASGLTDVIVHELKKISDNF